MESHHKNHGFLGPPPLQEPEDVQRAVQRIEAMVKALEARVLGEMSWLPSGKHTKSYGK